MRGPGTRRLGLVLALVLVGACAPVPVPSGPAAPSTAPGASGTPGADPSATDATVPPPAPGHELYGFLPYWEMDDPGIADHVAAQPLTTLALFSVTHTGKGAINTNAQGHGWVTGDVGRRLIADAHARGTRVEIVYTSFGAPRNRRLLEDTTLQGKVIDALVGTVRDLGVDGINVDIEALDPMLVPAYGTFLGDLLGAVEARDPALTVSVATGGHALGAAMAVAAAAAGVDRIFLMGYDYRTGRSDPGATAPLDRSDGDTASLRSSLDLYGALGVPADRLLLGLPLYGVDWPVAGPVIGGAVDRAWRGLVPARPRRPPHRPVDRPRTGRGRAGGRVLQRVGRDDRGPVRPALAVGRRIALRPIVGPAVRRSGAAGRSHLACRLRRHAGDARAEARPRE